jgi:glycosyltransferase involved in cell wall biosynthesis
MSAVKVAFDTGPLHGPRTGIGHAVEALHEALAARDDVELVDYLLSLRARPRQGVVRLPLPACLAHRSWRRWPHPRVDRWLTDSQVVHGTNYVVPPSRLPRLVSVYDCWFLRNPDRASPAVRRAGEVLRAAAGSGAVVHTSSTATEQSVRELLPGATVHTVHLGPLPLPPPAASPPIPELVGHPFVLSIGTVERRKNLPTLVKAFSRIASEHSAVRLVLAGGNGDDLAATRAAVDSLGPTVAARVLFTGRIGESARSWLLHNAAVLAYPSLDEGFGFPLLDAMQAGTPVVASNAGSIPEVAGDAALLCDPLDTEALAAALSVTLTDGDVRARLVAQGEQQWRRFSWTRCAEEMAGLYRRLADGTAQGLR